MRPAATAAAVSAEFWPTSRTRTDGYLAWNICTRLERR
jgi:hypothetical protein